MAIAFASKQEELEYIILTEALERGEIIGFDYQEQLFGGRSVRGGIVLDFLVYNPLSVAVMVQGSYWHEGELDGEERLVIARLQMLFDKVVQLWEPDMQTKESAIAANRREGVF